MLFKGEYDFLSNMYPCKIKDELNNGVTFKCAEAYFQSLKVRDDSPLYNELMELFSHMDGYEAKKYGRKVYLRENWEIIKFALMKEVVGAKFRQNRALTQRLINTGDIELVEHNSWGDTFWGVCNGFGKNMLGIILMEIREELRG